MNDSKTRRELAKKQDRNLAHSSPGGLVLVLTLCLMAIGGCQPGADPLQKSLVSARRMLISLLVAFADCTADHNRFDSLSG